MINQVNANLPRMTMMQDTPSLGNIPSSKPLTTMNINFAAPRSTLDGFYHQSAAFGPSRAKTRMDSTSKRLGELDEVKEGEDEELVEGDSSRRSPRLIESSHSIEEESKHASY